MAPIGSHIPIASAGRALASVRNRLKNQCSTKFGVTSRRTVFALASQVFARDRTRKNMPPQGSCIEEKVHNIDAKVLARDPRADAYDPRNLHIDGGMKTITSGA